LHEEFVVNGTLDPDEHEVNTVSLTNHWPQEINRIHPAVAASDNGAKTILRKPPPDGVSTFASVALTDGRSFMHPVAAQALVTVMDDADLIVAGTASLCPWFASRTRMNNARGARRSVGERDGVSCRDQNGRLWVPRGAH